MKYVNKKMVIATSKNEHGIHNRSRISNALYRLSMYDYVTEAIALLSAKKKLRHFLISPQPLLLIKSVSQNTQFPIPLIGSSLNQLQFASHPIHQLSCPLPLLFGVSQSFQIYIYTEFHIISIEVIR